MTFRLPVPAERLQANPNVRRDVRRVALRRGPLIYCVEEANNPGGPVQTLALPRYGPLKATWRDDLLGGTMTLTVNAERLVPGDESGSLYSTTPPERRNVPLTALPYHFWANREPGSMQVWIARRSSERHPRVYVWSWRVGLVPPTAAF